MEIFKTFPLLWGSEYFPVVTAALAMTMHQFSGPLQNFKGIDFKTINFHSKLNKILKFQKPPQNAIIFWGTVWETWLLIIQIKRMLKPHLSREWSFISSACAVRTCVINFINLFHMRVCIPRCIFFLPLNYHSKFWVRVGNRTWWLSPMCVVGIAESKTCICSISMCLYSCCSWGGWTLCSSVKWLSPKVSNSLCTWCGW